MRGYGGMFFVAFVCGMCISCAGHVYAVMRCVVGVSLFMYGSCCVVVYIRVVMLCDVCVCGSCACTDVCECVDVVCSCNVLCV